VDCNLAVEITRRVASEEYAAAAARLPELQEYIAGALSAAPDDAARERILGDVLATYQRWMNLTQSLRAQTASRLSELAAEQGYLTVADGSAHIVQSVG
jgi:hypothetical protein